MFALCTLALSGWGSILRAQSSEQRRVQVPTGAEPADPFFRYATPGECVRAAERLQQRYWRDKRPDTVVYAPATDSVPAPVVAGVHACASRFSSRTVPVSELRDLATLYLWARQDTLARQAIDQFFRAIQSLPSFDRAWQLSLWAQTLFSVHPTRVAWARATIAELDALGARAARDRVDVHLRASDYALSINDRAVAVSEARAAIAAGHQMSMNDRIDGVRRLESAYMALAMPVALMQTGAAALSVLDTMTTELAPLRPAGSGDQRQLLTALANDRIRFAALGRTDFPRVHADAWYGADGDTVRPRPGKLTLLTFFYGVDYPTFATLRRLHEQYGARGLDIVFMTTTQGYFRSMPMPEPTVEADSMGSYIRNFLKLPGVLAVELTSFSHIADGRRRNEETANLKAFGQAGGALLIDRRGVVRWVDDLRPARESMWDAVIQSAL